MSDLVTVILAAGKGTRMKSALPKVLHRVGGKSMLQHVLDAAKQAGSRRDIVVVGFGGEKVKEAMGDQAEFVVQKEQLGTGHAVQQTASLLAGETGTVMVLCGDTPVRLPPAQLAWLAWWAQHALQASGPQSWRHADAQTFLRLYRCVVGVDAVAYETAKELLSEGMEKEFFQQNNAKLERALKIQLGLAAAPYLLATSGKRPHTMRSLNLNAEAITLITGMETS